MSKGRSEGLFRTALNSIDLELVVVKPPDDARNWKPCDFMVWWPNTKQAPFTEDRPYSAWFEVKDAGRAVSAWPVSDLRPSQRAGIRDAGRIGLPYWVAIFWPRRQRWTLTPGAAIYSAIAGLDPTTTSLGYGFLASAGIDADPLRLGSTIRAILEDEL